MFKREGLKAVILIVLVSVFGIIIFSMNDYITGNYASEKPDIFISEFYISDNVLDFLNNRFYVNVCNNKNIRVNDYDVRFVLNGHEYKEFKRGVLEPNECVLTSTSFKPFMENLRIVESLVSIDSTNKISESNENNNRMFKKFNLSSYSPNLVVSGIDIIKSGSDNKIRVKFCNKSPKAFINRQIGITVSVDKIQRYIPYYLNMKPDSCAEVYSPALSEYKIGLKREFLVEVDADKDEFIVESDENDNYLSKRITI
ncbi:MAG: CARDB domain-containing protein [Nanoarchaeota archaeon]